MLSSEEAALVSDLTGKLSAFQSRNSVKMSYYDGQHKPKNVGLTVPRMMRGDAPRVGWAGVVVDALEERLNFLGWHDPSGTLGLDQVYAANRLQVESGLAHLDALVFGTAFVAVGTGAEGEPNPLVTVHPTMRTTGLWNGRNRRLSAALTVNADVKGEPKTAVLYLPNVTIQLALLGRWVEVSRDEHGLGRVPVVMLPNRTSASMLSGHSEVSASVRDIVDEAARVLLSMAVNREFFSAPQRLVLGADPDDIDGWKTLMSGIWTIEPDEDGNLPKVTQFDAVNPGPHIDQLRALAQQLASVAGIPETYLGVAPQANPTSADAIRAAEVRLIKKAERRASMFGLGWLDVAELILLVRDGHVPEEYAKVTCRWSDPATPTRAAIADETAKLVGAGILPPTSEVTLARIGLTDAEKDTVLAERAQAPSMASVLAGVVDRQATGDNVKNKFDALGVAIRSGVDPQSAAREVGLPGVEFTGAIPVSLRLPEKQAANLEEA